MRSPGEDTLRTQPPTDALGPSTSMPADRGAVTRVSGEIDIATSADFAAIVADAPSVPVDDDVENTHLDLGGVRFIDMAGVRVLVAAAAQRAPGALIIHRPPPMLARILDICWGPVPGLRLEPQDQATASQGGIGT